MRVGVAPGTTTIVLTGPTTPCENPARERWQRVMLAPPGKVGALSMLRQAAPGTQLCGPGPAYGMDQTLGCSRRPVAGLGYLVTPAGYNQAGPSGQIVAATGRQYCENPPRMESRGPSYRWQETAVYEADGAPVDNLGAVPTDIQLSSQYGFTPVSSQWVNFKEGTWAPLPWSPPGGKSVATDYGYITAPLGAAGDVEASAAVEELKRHNDKMFLLGVIGTSAAAATALVTVLKHLRDARQAHRGILQGAKTCSKNIGKKKAPKGFLKGRR